MLRDIYSAKTLVDVFKISIERFADRTCFIMRPKYRTLRWTYREFSNFSIAMASLLQKRGLKKGDRVLLLAPNSSWWQAAFWGCQLAGMIPVPLMVQSTLEFVSRVARQTNARMLLKVTWIKKPRHVSCPAADIDTLCFQVKKHSNILQNVGMFFSAAKEDDIAEILYTSGTTGDPKGVPLSHKNIVSNLKSILHLIPIQAQDKAISFLPLSHIFEQMVELRGLTAGATIIYVPSLSSSVIAEAFKEHKVTLMAIVPEFLRLLWRRIEAETSHGIEAPIFHFLFLLVAMAPRFWRGLLFFLVHKKFGGMLRLIITGAAPLDPQLGRRWQLLGFTLLQGYGLTETSPVLTVTPFSSTNIKSVGKAVPGVELKIAQDGEVLARGPNVFSGYWKNPTKTKEAFEGHWFKTGDMGYFDKEGFLYLTGRKKFMILTESGQNVYPEDIEQELNRQKGVEDSCVVPLEREKHIEIHAVLLAPSLDNPEKVIARVNKRLASFQQIHSWSLWPFPDFPRTVTRKAKRWEVLQYLTERTVPKVAETSRKEVSPLQVILSDISGVRVGRIKDTTKLVHDLKLDSLGRIELVAQIEERFGIELDEGKIGYETTLKDLEKLILEKPKKKVKYKLVSWPRSFFLRLLRPCLQKVVMFPLLWFFTKIDVQGGENLKNLPLPCIFMANHLSDLDSPVIIKALPEGIRKNLAIAAATDVLYERYSLFQPLVAIFVNNYPFQRKEQISLDFFYTGKLLDQGWSILVFPEGQISETGKILPFKLGAGLLAVEMGVPVVPVKITGTNKILPLHWRLPYPRKFRGRVKLVFGKPIFFSKKSSYLKATKTIEKAIREL